MKIDRSTVPACYSILALIASILALALVLAPQAGAAETGPAGDAFYEPPSKLPKGHGKLIWKRGSGQYVRLDNAAYTKNVLYTSKSPQRAQVAVSGSISVPEGKAPQGGWPVISYAHGTTGVADVCAPSKASAKNPALLYTTYVYPQLEEWLAAGYAVLRSDYPGLGTPGPHPYLIGKSEARGVLDIIRAARDFDREHRQALPARRPLAGWSGGAVLRRLRRELDAGPEAPRHGLLLTRLAPARAGGRTVRSLTSPSPSLGAGDDDPLRSDDGESGNRRRTGAGAEAVRALSAARGEVPPRDRPEQPATGSSPRPICSSAVSRTRPSARCSAKMNPDVETEPPIFLAQGSADGTVFPLFTDQLTMSSSPVATTSTTTSTRGRPRRPSSRPPSPTCFPGWSGG